MGLYTIITRVSMKFILTLILCSGISSQCLPPYQVSVVYDNMYACLKSGYDVASKKIDQLGPAEVNKYYYHVKFYCQPQQET
jgi:hypothetical protein